MPSDDTDMKQTPAIVWAISPKSAPVTRSKTCTPSAAVAIMTTSSVAAIASGRSRTVAPMRLGAGAASSGPTSKSAPSAQMTALPSGASAPVYTCASGTATSNTIASSGPLTSSIEAPLRTRAQGPSAVRAHASTSSSPSIREPVRAETMLSTAFARAMTTPSPSPEIATSTTSSASSTRAFRAPLARSSRCTPSVSATTAREPSGVTSNTNWSS